MNIFVILFIICIQAFNAHASRGWYVSIGGVSAKQNHDVSNYSHSQNVSISRQASVNGIPAIPQTNIYWFTQDATTQDTFQTYSSFTNLQNAVNGNYVTSQTEFNLENNIANGTSSPFFTITSGNANATLSNNANPTNTTGGTIADGIITHNATGQEVARIDRYSGSASLYKVTLSPISFSQAFYQNEILNEISSSNATINASQKMQDFINLFNDQSSRTAEVSFGYKFRPFRSTFFIAPQVDFTRFKNNTSPNTAYYNPTTQAMLASQDGSSTQVSYSNMDLSYTASLIFKLGFEQRFWLFGQKIPFSIYGLLGGASSFRKINSIRDNAFGFKYGLGGEIFASENLAFFGEFYQIQYISQNYTFERTTAYTGNAFNSTNGFSANISNGGTGAGEKIISFNYPSDSQALAAQIKTNERYNLQSRISAFKFGLTYYFQ